jgi:hypothetical protein
MRLAETTTWRRLVHYRSGLFGTSSEADGKPFFLSEDGRDDPDAELAATLRGFFGKAPADKRIPHPYCRFPARLAWLNSKLQFDFKRVPRRSCPRFQEFVKQIKARSLVLVFSSYYLNNPASAFGHTFLRINKHKPADAEEGLELLDYGIDFSAEVDTGNAIIYAFKGMTGMFPGLFRKVPYYLKVREYNDYESRDLWEYELNLDKQQLSMFVAHLWELGFNYFDYFYLSENCSYHILAALEVANPKWKLLDRVGWPVIPADTVKAVVREPGLVRRVDFRPSNRTQFRLRLAALSEAEADMLSELLDDPKTPFAKTFDKRQQARVVDAALDWVDFEYAGDLVRGPDEDPDPEGMRMQQTLLERRAALLVESEDLPSAPPFRQQPHLAHGSSRLGLGSGWLEERGAFHTLDFRLALHDLADPSPGYPDEAAIEFVPLRLRYYAEDPTISLEELDLIRVTSLRPLGRFDSGFSWQLRAGSTRFRDDGCGSCYAGLLEFGAGLTLQPFGSALTAWLFADALVAAPVDGGVFDALRAGPGPLAGLRLRLGENVAAVATAKAIYLPVQEPELTWEGTGALRMSYVKDFGLSIEARAQPNGTAVWAVSHLYF